MRLIDADQMAIDESEAYLSAQCQIKDELARSVNAVVHTKIQRLIADAPTVEAVEVVRCKDCKHKGWIQEPCHGKSVDFCNVFDSTINNPEKCFCYYGERRKNERSNQERGSV